jgi:hypothetical protein
MSERRRDSPNDITSALVIDKKNQIDIRVTPFDKETCSTYFFGVFFSYNLLENLSFNRYLQYVYVLEADKAVRFLKN